MPLARVTPRRLNCDWEEQVVLPSDTAESLRLLVAGDTHGNATWLEVLFNRALEHRCDVLVQLGDFGYWPHTRDGQRFLRRVEFLAKRVRVPIVWIDGNHENHAMLRTLSPRPDGFVELSTHVLHAPRGLRWNWAGIRFGALGGAFSIDWRRRVLGVSWWAEEVITPEDVATLTDDPLDVLLTHDAPAGIPIEGLPLSAPDELRSYDNRRLIATAVESTNAQVLLHGHWHYRYQFDLTRIDATASKAQGRKVWETTRVEGLASDQERDGGAWGVLELPTLEFTDGHALVASRSN